MEQDNRRKSSERRNPLSRREAPTASGFRPRSARSVPRSPERRRTRQSPNSRNRTQPEAAHSSPRREQRAHQTESGATERPQRRQRATYSVPQQDWNQDSAYQRRAQSPSAGRRRKKKRPHRVYNTNFGFKFMTMLAVVAVIVISMMIFFKVKHINVVLQGVDSSASALALKAPKDAAADPSRENTATTDETGARASSSDAESAQPSPGQTHHSYYTEEDIIAASGIHIDDNLLSLSKATVASRIHAALPYVNQIQIKKELPGTVVITVSEFDVSYGIQDEQDGWWLMTREGRILEPATEEDLRDHLLITGMPISVPQVGDWFKPASVKGADMNEISAKQTAVLAIIPALEQMPFVKQIERVDVSTSYNVTLWYGTRYEIRLGTIENLNYKLRFLDATLAEKELQHRSGTIDLTFTEDNKAHFMEFR